MIASLPMYDLPEIATATDALWQALSRRFGVDVSLSRGPDWTMAWRRPDLLFSQTCGYPFTHAFKGVLTYVATPHYDAEGCEGPRYCSLLMARDEIPLKAFAGKRAAINNWDSMSGMLALQLAFAPIAEAIPFFESVIETGSHAASLAAVQSGAADVCAIDCVTFALLKRHRPQLVKGLCCFGKTPAVPGLPFVTRAGDVAELRQALAALFDLESLEAARSQLLLAGVSFLPANAYDIIPQLQDEIMRKFGGKMLF